MEWYERVMNWWGEATMRVGGAVLRQIGPFGLYLARAEQEWRIGVETDDSYVDGAGVGLTSRALDAMPDLVGMERYLFSMTPDSIWLTPRLADRPVVSRPLTPALIPAGESVTVYVTSPVWVEIAVGKKKIPLSVLPLQRPSDTWFGPSKTRGELCFASGSAFAVSAESLIYRPHRAVTAVTIVNRGEDLFRIDRMSIPTPSLSLYSGEQGWLWTSGVRIERREALESVIMAIDGDDEAPSNCSGAQLVREPLKKQNSNVMTRALNTIFG